MIDDTTTRHPHLFRNTHHTANSYIKMRHALEGILGTTHLRLELLIAAWNTKIEQKLDDAIMEETDAH